jgi:hypothetical protein
MARSLITQRHDAVLKIALALAAAAGVVAVAIGSGLAARPVAATVTTRATDAAPGSGIPWWKKTLSHTVQEEWAFALQMEQQYGPRWRTSLSDKAVMKLYQQFCEGASPVDPVARSR